MRGVAVLIALSSALAVGAEYTGFWRQTCSVITKARVDPIVARGTLPSKHAHMVRTESRSR